MFLKSLSNGSTFFFDSLQHFVSDGIHLLRQYFWTTVGATTPGIIKYILQIVSGLDIPGLFSKGLIIGRCGEDNAPEWYCCSSFCGGWVNKRIYSRKKILFQLEKRCCSIMSTCYLLFIRGWRWLFTGLGIVLDTFINLHMYIKLVYDWIGSGKQRNLEPKDGLGNNFNVYRYILAMILKFTIFSFGNNELIC